MNSVLSFGGIDSKSGMLTDILSAFLRFIAEGGDRIAQSEAKLAGGLLALQLLKLIANVGFRKAGPAAFFSFIGALVWYHVATESVAVSAAFVSWLGSLGSAVSGGAVDTEIMRDPSRFMGLGLSAAKAIWEKGDSFNILLAFSMAVLYLALGILVIACFTVLGLVVVFVVIDTSIDVLLGIALVPFFIEPRLAFLGMRGVWLIVDAGMLLGKTSIAVGISYGFLTSIHLQPDPSLRDAINLAAATFICAKLTGSLATVTKGAKMAAGAIF